MKLDDLFKKVDQTINECGGRIIKGVNTTQDINVDSLKTNAAKFGNKVNRDGYPPILPTSGKISSTVPKERDLSAMDKKASFGRLKNSK